MPELMSNNRKYKSVLDPTGSVTSTTGALVKTARKLVSIKGDKFLYKLNDRQLLKKNSVPQSCLCKNGPSRINIV